LRGRPYSIVGVAPSSFTGVTPGISAELWVPVSMVEDIEPVGLNDYVESPGATRLERRGSRWFFVLGRLRPGVTVAAAEANLTGIMASLEREYPRSNEARTPTVVPASTVRFHPIVDAALRPTGIVLLAAVGLVLLIACANLASMLLAQGAARRREIAVRTAIGASRTRVVRQLVVENLVLSTIGGMAGVLLGFCAVRLLAAFQPPVNLPLSLDIAPGVRVIAFGVFLSLATGIISAFIPAVRASRSDLVPALKDDARAGGARHRTLTLRSGLVVVQIATSLVLVVSGILLARSFASAVTTDPGFRAAGLAVATIGLDFHGYSPSQGRQFYERALERVSRLPGVVSAGISERLPFSANIINTAVMVDGQPDAAPRGGLSVDSTRVSSGYFATMELAPIDGRLFDDRDTPDTPTVAVINLAMAERLFPGERAIDRRLIVPDTGVTVDVVGVVPNHAVRAIGEAPRPLIHFARSQQYTAYATIVARTSGSTDELALGMTRELRALEPDLILMESGGFDRLIGLSLFPVRAGGVMLGGLAALAMVLAGIGLYGSLAFAISQQTREIGIRMALGAQRRVVVRTVLREGLVLFGVGAAIGVGLAALSAGALSGVLYGVAPLDPVSFSLAVLVLGVIAAVASLVPAARAASVDPLVALRQS
jgi:predicted permease